MEVHLWSTLAADADGQHTLRVEARTIRELFNELQTRYPAMEAHLKAGIAVSIDGTIYRDSWSQPLPEGAEIVLLPRIAGGA